MRYGDAFDRAREACNEHGLDVSVLHAQEPADQPAAYRYEYAPTATAHAIFPGARVVVTFHPSKAGAHPRQP